MVSGMPIQGYRDERLSLLLAESIPKGFATALAAVIRRKLAMLNAAKTLADLRTPRNNDLQSLGDGRKGQYSIRLDRQFRLCFRWTSLGPDDVELADYH
jgi:proteic killer suppression protein